ncbi:MAG: hypothetical protein ACOYBC_01980 [Bilifractor sp.]|jgi:cell division septum initiation protein DivIVA
MAENEEMFKTQIVGEDGETKVVDQTAEKIGKAIQKKGENSVDTLELRDEIRKKDEEIERLRAKVDEKDSEIDELKRDIREKYQSYIDNYESIGSLVYDAKVRSDQMIRDAEEKKNQIISDAEAEAERKVDAVQDEIDRRIDDGEQRYKSVEEELESIIDMVNQVQRKFMESYRSIHKIVRDMPGMEEGGDEEEE